MQPESDDDAWRAIVDNYGDPADLDPADRTPVPAHPEQDLEGGPADADLETWDDERFVPPPVPPLPAVTPDRMAAWVGLFGSPTVLLLSLLIGIHLPSWLGYLLVAGFLGGFGYLVAQMPRGPRDPGDDGARL